MKVSQALLLGGLVTAIGFGSLILLQTSGETHQVARSHLYKASNDLRDLRSAIDHFKSERSVLPLALSELQPTYIRSIPKDPWGREYHYVVSGQKFLLMSLGMDAKPGGNGECADMDANTDIAEVISQIDDVTCQMSAGAVPQ